MRLRWIVLCVLASLLLGGPTDARRRRAKRADTSPAAKVYAEGKRLFAAKDYLGALEAFERSYKLRPHFLVQCNIARCHERLGRMIEAAERYRSCLSEGAEKTKTAGKVREALKVVEARITWVEVVSPGEGGTLYVNGREVGAAGQRIPLNPGSAVVEVRRPGALPARATLDARGGELPRVELVPRPIVVPQPAVRRPPPPPPPVAPPPPKSRRRVHQAWFWTAAAVTVGLSVAYAVVGVQALQTKSEYEDSPTHDEYWDAIERRKLANILFGVAAAAAGTTTVLAFFTDFGGAKEKPAGERAASFGLGLRGAF